ncbi:hypothetical protein SAZ11_62580 [Streptomyces sp. FXJ1.4098]|nr:hypothetical protein [Streptomyces sp. FXJ1.4098]
MEELPVFTWKAELVIASELTGGVAKPAPSVDPCAARRDASLEKDPVDVGLASSLGQDQRCDHGILLALPAFDSGTAFRLFLIRLSCEPPSGECACLCLPEEN